jgi:hypothetical protein
MTGEIAVEPLPDQKLARSQSDRRKILPRSHSPFPKRCNYPTGIALSLIGISIAVSIAVGNFSWR